MAHPDLPGFTLTFRPTVIPTNRPDGAVLVIPGRAVAVDDDAEVSIREAAEILRGRYSTRHLRRLARDMGARQRARRCKLSIPARMVAALKERRG